jgi:hypothetical protein
MTEQETTEGPVQPLYDPEAARWFSGRYSAPTVRELLAKMPEGTVIADYYPCGYAATRDGVPVGRAELRTQYNKPKFHLRPLPVTQTQSVAITGAEEMVAREPVRRPRAAGIGRAPTGTRGKYRRRRASPDLPKLLAAAVAKSKTSWVDEEMATLRELAAAGYTAYQIGEAVGRSRNAVIGQCHRRGIELKTSAFFRRGAYKR